MVATLVIGLNDDSRIKRKITGNRLTLEQSLLALIVDGVNKLVWLRTKDGIKGRNQPQSLFKKLMGMESKPKKELMSFKTAEEYEAWYKAKMRS